MSISEKKVRIVVSGWGAVSCAGKDAEESLRNMLSPEHGRIPGPASDRVGTTLKDPVFELTEYEGERGIGRSHSLALTAIREALDRAGLTMQELSGTDTGICFGTTVAAQMNSVPLYEAIRKGTSSDCGEALRRFWNSSPAEYLQRRLNLSGPALCVSNACASGSDVLGIAFAWISAGLCRRVIAVGADEMNRVPVAGFHALGITSPEPCRPFDRYRRGLNLGEGGGALILEEESSAVQRKYSPRIRLAGYGNACDAWHMTSPHPEGRGLQAAMENSLQYAGITKDQVSFILAHGTSTLANDKCEGALFSRFFGPRVRYLSTKGWTGHTLGAAGAMEAVFTIEMLLQKTIPPSRGFHAQDPEIPVPPVSCITALTDPVYAISTSLALGGSNSSVLLERLS